MFEHHLDLLVAAQADDGGWGVNWEAWAPVTVPEWRGHVTVERLKLLRAHGRWKDVTARRAGEVRPGRPAPGRRRQDETTGRGVRRR